MKKKFNLFLLLLVFFPCMLLMSACGSQPVKFDIKFMVDGETYATVETGGNETISMPEDPTKDGYEFDGWYKEKECINIWDFEKEIIPEKMYDSEGNYNYKETIIYAKWK